MWLLVALLAVVAGLLAFASVRTRRAHARALEERGWLLEREREAAARKAVDAERARIAHDLHDIVSHNVSLMIVQAAAAREVLATMPGEAAEALAAIEGAGRNTMTELRNLLGLLAPPPHGGTSEDDDAPDAGLAPQPSLSRLSPLIDRIAFAGLPVDVRAESPAEVAEIFLAQRKLEIESALLVAVPVPENFEMPAADLERTLNAALDEAKRTNIKGRDMTPFLLSAMAKSSEGATLATNIALLENNARVAAAIAATLANG